MIGYLILAFGCVMFGAIIGLLVAGLCQEAASAERAARAARENAAHLERAAQVGWIPGPYRSQLTAAADAANVVPINLARRRKVVMP